MPSAAWVPYIILHITHTIPQHRIYWYSVALAGDITPQDQSADIIPRDLWADITQPDQLVEVIAVLTHLEATSIPEMVERADLPVEEMGLMSTIPTKAGEEVTGVMTVAAVR